MPESYGKRQRNQVKAKKANAKEERRLARNQRRADREAGVLAPGPGEGPPNDSVDLAMRETAPNEEPETSEEGTEENP
jgi:hypothetical protein